MRKRANIIEWYWKQTVKWYFFPLFYFLLALLLTILSAIEFGTFRITGDWSLLMFLVYLPIGSNIFFGIEVSHFFYYVISILYVFILFVRNSQSKFLKPAIVVLTILLLTSFTGCVLGIFDGSY